LVVIKKAETTLKTAAALETQPTSGKVGAAVKILGTDLTGATSVTFNVPAGAPLKQHFLAWKSR
jgi:hypothetical protein